MSMDRTIQALQDSGVTDQLSVLIGGGPINQDFADKIGVDGYDSNAASAADLAKKIVN